MGYPCFYYLESNCPAQRGVFSCPGIKEGPPERTFWIEAKIDVGKGTTSPIPHPQREQVKPQ
jgi:hypothetical protein